VRPYAGLIDRKGWRLMLTEAAVGTVVSWLWGQLGNAAESQDAKNAIKKALEESIEESFRTFKDKYPDFSESFFTQELLEGHVSPEIHKFLTRNEHPNTESVANALPDYVVLASNNEYKDEINEFFDMVMNSMKKHAVLQEIINNRQIDETNQIVKEISERQKSATNLLEEGFSKISFDQQHSNEKINEISSQSANQHAELMSMITGVQSQISTSLPESKSDGLHKLITKHLDKTRDLITDGRVNDARELLDSIEDEVSASDGYTRFRWHTNVGACYLAHGQGRSAAEQCFTAFNFAKDEEKAIANRIRAYLLIDQFEKGLKESQKALEAFPGSGIIWALHINAKILLNVEFDNSLLPRELENDSTVLLALSDLKIRSNAYEESFDLAKAVFDKGDSLSDAKRSMLASALSWVTFDTLKSHYGQYSEQQHNALEFAFNSFGNIINFLNNTQGKQVFTEVAHNLAVATELLCKWQLKDEIITLAFSAHPSDETFIWHKVKQLSESDAIQDIHNLTDNKLDQFGKPLLFTLAEVSANTGDIVWNNAVRESLCAKNLDDRENDELLGLELCAIWKSGDKQKAIESARKNLDKIILYPSLLTFYIRILNEHGEHDERDKLIQSFVNLPSDLSSQDTLQIADLFYDFGRYYEAAKLYVRIIELPSDDYLTKRYLDSLIKSDQRSRAALIFEGLPNSIRRLSTFKRIEINLARSSGDLDKLENILTEELQSHPLDSGIAAGYVVTLYRKNRIDDLQNYFSTNPTYDPIIETNEIEIAKCQMELGLEHQAMLRMYRLFRSHPSNSQIAGHYLLLMLLIKQFDTFKGLDVVTLGSAIYFECGGRRKTVVVEPNDISTEEGWPECISENNELAKNLIGLRIGDSVDIDSGMNSQLSTIVGIDSMFIFASNLAHKVVADSASSVGPVWSVNVRKPDGEFDFSPIVESLKSRRQHVEHVFNVYDEKKIPLQILSDALGTDVVSLLLDWPYKQYDLFVCSGVHEERESIKDLITEGEKPYVIDLSCLVELQRLGLLQESLNVLKRPLVSASLREQLSGLIQVHSKLKPSGITSEIDGQLTYHDIPQEYYDDRKKFLIGLLEFVDSCCEVVPVIGPSIVTEQQTTIGERLGYSSHDVIYLTLERDAILVSEDGGFRSLAMSLGVTSSTWLQPLLMILRDRNVINEGQYSRNILDKLNRRHNFTSVTADDLLWAAKSCPNLISPDVESAIETFRSPTLDLASGVVVGSQFLKGIVEHINPSALHQYYKLILEVLSFGRERYSSNIHESLRSHIVSNLPLAGRKKERLINRKFGGKLLPQKVSFHRPRLKPLVIAIKLAIRS